MSSTNNQVKLYFTDYLAAFAMADVMSAIVLHINNENILGSAMVLIVFVLMWNFYCSVRKNIK